MPDQATIDQIKAKLEELGMSRAALARTAGIPESSLKMHLIGRQPLSAPHMEKVKAFLGL